MDAYLARYSSWRSRNQIARYLNHLFRLTGRRHPAEVTEADLFGWVRARADDQDGPLANNTVRQRLSCVRSFFGWCQRKGLISTDPTLELDVLRRSYPRTYGKTQAPHPARWLTRREAFEMLVPTCQDGTARGLRDEIALRLGLAGLRSSEITALTFGTSGWTRGGPASNGSAKRASPATSFPAPPWSTCSGPTWSPTSGAYSGLSSGCTRCCAGRSWAQPARADPGGSTGAVP